MLFGLNRSVIYSFYRRATLWFQTFLHTIQHISRRLIEDLTSLWNTLISVPLFWLPAAWSLLHSQRNSECLFCLSQLAGRSGSRPPTACSCCCEYKVQSECIHHRLAPSIQHKYKKKKTRNWHESLFQRHFETLMHQFTLLFADNCSTAQSDFYIIDIELMHDFQSRSWSEGLIPPESETAKLNLRV